MRHAVARTVGVAGFLAAVNGCGRTPPEPTPASTTNSPAVDGTKRSETATASAEPRVASAPASAPVMVASASARPERCITATPDVAPPIPPPASAAACPPDPEGIGKLPIAQVGFPEAKANPKVEVEIVKSEHDIQRGLMYRRTMPEGHGMLFHLEDRRDHNFWMHNTCISLDMLFVDDDGTVVGIVEGATPLDETTRSVGCPSTYVLEVNAGWCRRHGVRAGQKMGIPSAAR